MILMFIFLISERCDSLLEAFTRFQQCPVSSYLCGSLYLSLISHFWPVNIDYLLVKCQPAFQHSRYQSPVCDTRLNEKPWRLHVWVSGRLSEEAVLIIRLTAVCV